MTRRALAVAVLAAAGSACTRTGAPVPVLEAVSPPRAPAGTAVDVSVRGSGFAPGIQADLEDPAASTVRGAFALTLVLGDERIPLERVAYVSDRELSARVPPLATPASYDLELVDPRGQVAVLPSAYAIDVAPGCGADGMPCDDGNACTQEDTCQGGTCVAGPSTCVNTAPHACLALAPAAVAAGEAIALDASCSTDGEDPPAALRARLDLDGDGEWDTPFAPIDTLRPYAYPVPGVFVATVQVVDTGGLSDFASRYAVVTAPDDLVLVTTARDEADPGAAPATPGGTGLSLREAISYVNALGAPRTIRVAVAEPIVHASALPALTAPGAAIVGDGAAPLEFPGVDLPCLTLDGAGQLLLGATVTGCTSTAVTLGTGSAGSQVAECTIAPAPTAHGVSARASARIGPRNLISGASSALRLTGSTFLVEENRIQGNQAGIFAVAGVDLTVIRNRVVSNLTYGLQATPSPGTCTILHNVFDANGGDGVDLLGFEGGLVAENNLFSRNGADGLRDGSPTATLDHNGFFANGRGDPSRADPTDLLADPLYTSDHRLAPGSPAIDRGVDTGLDVNGPAAGDFCGDAPDLGAWEAPCTDR